MMTRRTSRSYNFVLSLFLLIVAACTAAIYYRPWEVLLQSIHVKDIQQGTQSGLGTTHGTEPAVSHDQHDHGHGEHVDISAAAAKSLNLQLNEVAFGPYVKSLHVPAEIMEKPGQSGLSVTSPVQGIVETIHRFPGQALEAGDPLFTLQVADEALEAAQLSLLDILTRIAVTELEIQRLNPLAESGAIVGRRKLEMDYQLKQLVSEQSARLQELRLRGLSESQIERIVQHRELINQIEVRLETSGFAVTLAGSSTPEARLASVQMSQQNEQPISATSDSAAVNSTKTISGPTGPIFTLEQLDVFPGRRVAKGEQLCHIANHFELFIRGHAFESDVVAVSQAMSKSWPVLAETGKDESTTQIRDLTITYIDNHVDASTQTFPFYMPLPNRVISEQRDAQGRLFRSWQFKPGQRAHLFIPLETWNDQIVLPRDAVVRSGPESIVFRLPAGNAFQRRLTVQQRLARTEQSKTWELEPVPVQLLHQDRSHCVIAKDGELQSGDIVVMNRAYQLFMAWKMQSTGGAAGHTHDH
jgi:cobalt-zinc-cadmium efflux system membrane fusion protein